MTRKKKVACNSILCLQKCTNNSATGHINLQPYPSPRSRHRPVPKVQGFRALGAAQSRRSSALVSSVPLRVPLLEKRAELLLPGFFHGFFAGLVIVALLLAAFFGGERFSTKSTDRLGSLAHSPMSSPRLQLPLVPLRQGDQSLSRRSSSQLRHLLRHHLWESSDMPVRTGSL